MVGVARVGVIALALVALVPIEASAQISQSSGIAGVVRDTSGAVMPGVVQLIAPGTVFGDRISTLDFRILKAVKVGRYRLQGTLQFFNVLNSSGILTYNTNYGTAISNASWNQALSELQGRYLQLTTQFNF